MNDASYKRLLTHRRIIEDLLVGFIAPRRPAVWADALDFDSLREGPTENVDDDLSRSLDDVVWSIDRRAAGRAVQRHHLPAADVAQVKEQVLHSQRARRRGHGVEDRSVAPACVAAGSQRDADAVPLPDGVQGADQPVVILQMSERPPDQDRTRTGSNPDWISVRGATIREVASAVSPRCPRPWSAGGSRRPHHARTGPMRGCTCLRPLIWFRT